MWQRPARLALWGSISGLRGRAPKKDRADRDGSSLRHGRTKESPAGAVAEVVGIGGGVVSGFATLLIPALERRSGDHAMTSNITTAQVGDAEELLFDSWFDPIEDGLRAKVRGFIETMIEEELTGALSRPRYGRRQEGKEAAVGAVGYRHGRRMRRLTGTFGSTDILV